jgi:excisionase family DNA binding protein
MATIRPEVTGRALEPLAVSPRQACLLLGVGNTRLYQLIGAGELEAYHEGRAPHHHAQHPRARRALSFHNR